MARLISIKPLYSELAELNLYENDDENHCKVNESANETVNQSCFMAVKASSSSSWSSWKKFFSSVPRLHHRSGSYDVNRQPFSIYISQQKVNDTSRVPNKRPCRRSFSSSRSRFHRSSFTSDVSPPPKTICAPIRPPLSLGMQLFLCYCPCILLFTYIDGA